MPFRAKSKDDDSLYRCARRCYAIAGNVLEFLPRTRESQRILVNLLSGRLAASGEEFPIGVEFLADTVKCRDQHLLANWQCSFENLAWLMVHEALSNFFGTFVLANWDCEPYVVHYVPADAGLNLDKLIERESYFVAHPQITFDAMCATSGLLGFASQLWRFEHHCRPERLYLSGYPNLPTTLENLDGNGTYQGVSIVRSPAEAISWAIRHVWMSIERDDPAWAAAYPSLASQRLAEIHEAARGSTELVALAAMRETADAILQAPRFRESYDELLCKCYYSAKINDLSAVIGFFDRHRSIVPCVDAARDAELIRRQLQLDGEIAAEKTNTFGHGDLAAAFGGEDAFRTAIAPRILRSAEIYGALCMLRARSEPPMTAAQ
jgi:hypothetical protein